MSTQQIAYKLLEPPLRGKLPLNAVALALVLLVLLRHGHTADGADRCALHDDSSFIVCSPLKSMSMGIQIAPWAVTGNELDTKLTRVDPFPPQKATLSICQLSGQLCLSTS